VGLHESSGMKKGMVVNIDATVGAIQRALEEAELMADFKIRDVYTGIAGSHIKGSNANGMVKIKDKEVSQADIERVIETASSISLPGDQKILHILEQEFNIDGQDGIKKPLGMSGMRLEVEIHIVTGAVAAVQNIIKCVHRCGLEVREMILQPLASSKAVLAEDEKDLGVCMVDIGGGTTDIAVFTNGAIRHTAVIPIAGDQITNDIAMALRTPTRDAEDIKIKYGCALRQLAGDAPIEVPGVGDRGPRMLSRPAWRSCIRWCRPNCAAAVSRTCCRRASSSRAAAAPCRAWWSWVRRSSTCRCGWGCLTMWAGWPMSSRPRGLRRVWDCCCLPWSSSGAKRRRASSRVRSAMCWAR
jgi:cell division protein FtsA